MTKAATNIYDVIYNAQLNSDLYQEDIIASITQHLSVLFHTIFVWVTTLITALYYTSMVK